MGYKNELKELYEKHTGKAMEAALGLTVRSIQNYLKEKNARTPSPQTIEDIHELFANYKAGKGLVKLPKPEEKSALQVIAQLTNTNAELVQILKERFAAMDEKKMQLAGEDTPGGDDLTPERLKEKTGTK